MSAPLLSSLVGKVVASASDNASEVVIKFTDGTQIQAEQLHNNTGDIYVGSAPSQDE